MTRDKKLLILTFAALAPIFTAAPSFAAEYAIDPVHSRVGFSVRHMVGKVSGEFKDFEGTFTFDERKPATDAVKFTAQSASISTDNEKRDTHLRSPDFFDAAKYPVLSFVSKKVAKEGGKEYKVSGDLTLHGVTKPVTFRVEYQGTAKDPWGNQRAGFSAETRINRKDFGLLWNNTLETGGLLVGDEVKIALDVEAVQKK